MYLEIVFEIVLTASAWPPELMVKENGWGLEVGGGRLSWKAADMDMMKPAE